MVALHSCLRVSAVPVLGCKFLASISSQVHVLRFTCSVGLPKALDYGVSTLPAPRAESERKSVKLGGYASGTRSRK